MKKLLIRYCLTRLNAIANILYNKPDKSLKYTTVNRKEFTYRELATKKHIKERENTLTIKCSRQVGLRYTVVATH